MVKLLTILRNELDACEIYRILYKYMLLTNPTITSEGIPVNTTLETQLPNDILNYDVIVFHRNMFDIDLTKQLQSHGKKIIFDIDDGLDLEDYQMCITEYKQLNMKERIIEHANQSDLIICSTKYLKEHLQQYITKPIFISPNTIPITIMENSTYKIPYNKLRIAYTGSKSHTHDLSLLEDILMYLDQSKHTRDKYEFQIYGVHECSEYTDYYKLLTTNGRHKKNLKLYGYVQTPQWLSVYQNIDVALAPLIDIPYNRCKSELKYIESGYTNTAIIGSNLPMYKDCVDYMDLPKGKYEWREVIKRVIIDESFRHHIQERNKRYTSITFNHEVHQESLRNTIINLVNG